MKFERSLNQPKATRVCIHSINQSNHSISVCCFCFVHAFSFQGHTKIALTIACSRRSSSKARRSDDSWFGASFTFFTIPLMPKRLEQTTFTKQLLCKYPKRAISMKYSDQNSRSCSY